MQQKLTRIFQGLIGLVIVISIAAYFGAYTINEREQGLVLRFGKISRVSADPGLHFKLPWETVIKLDARLLSIEIQTDENNDALTKDQRRVVVDAFAKWRISDAALFYESFGQGRQAGPFLRDTMFDGLRKVIGDNDFESLLNENRVNMMQSILAEAKTAVEGRGISIQDVRIRRADLPRQNLEATFNRMRSDREQEATKLRAEGQAENITITAQARSQAEETVAEGRVRAETLRGQADIQAYQTIMEAIQYDAEFHAFYRSMQAYENALANGKGRFVLSPEASFFEYFHNIGGTEAPVQAPE